jgi:hypothetical protein
MYGIKISRLSGCKKVTGAKENCIIYIWTFLPYCVWGGGEGEGGYSGILRASHSIPISIRPEFESPKEYRGEIETTSFPYHSPYTPTHPYHSPSTPSP